MIEEEEEEQTHNVLGSKEEKNQFLKEIGQVRKDIVRFKNEMNGLAKQMDGMEIDLVSFSFFVVGRIFFFTNVTLLLLESIKR